MICYVPPLTRTDLDNTLLSLSFVCILSSYNLMTEPFDPANQEGRFIVCVVTQLLINVAYTCDFVIRVYLKEYR